jgi:hypothetical protein
VERADVEAIERDREALWAEAAALWRARGGARRGVAWEDAERLAAPEHAQYMIADEWEPAIEAWLEEVEAMPAGDGSDIVNQARGRIPFTASEVASGAIGLPLRDVGQLVQKRIGAILRKLGYTKHVLKIDGRNQKKFVRYPTATPPLPQDGGAG